MQIWAHRGASADAPENTMTAFETAHAQGADGIEFDVQRSCDGDPVVIHDATVDRTTRGEGAVADMATEELVALGIPTLVQVLAWLPAGMTANVELKAAPTRDTGLAAEVVQIIDAAGVGDRVWVSSFDHHMLQDVGRLDPTLRLGVLAVAHLWQPASYVKACGAGAYHPNVAALQTPQIISECHDAGLRVHTWTVDDQALIAKAADLGVDAVITNRPGPAREALS